MHWIGCLGVGHRSSWTAEEAVTEATVPCLPILLDWSGMALGDLTRYQTLHPLMTTSGRRRATRRSWPAASATRTTSVTSL
jgi:hypothetical protein